MKERGGYYKVILLLILMGFHHLAFSQNLLKNGDFEQYTKCPRSLDELDLCHYWSVPNLSSPDYFKTCVDTLTYLEPALNIAGSQLPNSGEAYTGIILIDHKLKTYAEYIQGELSQKLEAGEKYKLGLYISWAENSPYFFNKLGYLFSDVQIKPSVKERDLGKPQKNMLPKSQGHMTFEFEDLKSKKNWLYIETEYVAKGGEQYLILGVFKNNVSKKEREITFSKFYWEKTNMFKNQESVYFYIDEVAVTAVGNSNTLGQ